MLANATLIGLEESNAQLQVTLKRALQNRLVSDLLLLHENGICGYLSPANDMSCVHTANVTRDLSKLLHQMKCVAEASGELWESMDVGWLNKLLHGLGFSLTGLLQSVVIDIIVIVIFYVLLSWLKST